MPPTADTVANAVAIEAAKCLDQCLEKVRHCAGQLSNDQVWWRPNDEMNSVGNLLLHLTGNVRQWIVAGLGVAADVRDRPSEFNERAIIPKQQLVSELEAVVADAKRVLMAATPEDLLAKRRIQGWEVSGFEAIFDCVPHFKGHTQEIICLTRLQLGPAYRFHWQPQTSEQGA